ncbi:nuclear transport factor 2 family protein [Parasphingorhabdus sp.]|uniref:nuclear transport factor 2 family protein n=1 Tax=Parasphingorhabdus sp. TaxID=2709688 RepID=UPI0032645E62
MASNIIRVIISGLACLSLASCVTASAPTPHRALVEAYTAAFNGQDVPAMAAMMHPDIQWITVTAGKSAVTTDGKIKMVAEMDEYFGGSTKIRSTLSGWGINGAFVSAVETASWTSASGKKMAQSSNVIYQIDDGLIRRVWYFPEQPAQ